MIDAVGIPVLVFARQEEAATLVNSALREQGLAVHCHWFAGAGALVEAARLHPELILLFAEDGLAEPAEFARLRDQHCAGVPLVCVRAHLAEPLLLADLKAGAQDTVTATARARLQHVCSRELKAFRLQRALANTVSSARASQRQLHALVAGSADAIAIVQEGIVVEANPAWLDLVLHSVESVVGTPAMDLFMPESHPALRGALVASQQGRWEDHTLAAVVRLGNGEPLRLELELAPASFEGEPAVQLSVPAAGRDAAEVAHTLTSVLDSDPGTGVLHRQAFVERLRERAGTPPAGGVRHLAFIRPDGFEEAIAQVGPFVAEELIVHLGRLVRESLAATDLCGRLGGAGFMVLLERGTTRDVQTWADHLLQRIANEAFSAGERSVSMTISIGLGTLHSSVKDPAAPAADAVEAARQARNKGGNRVLLLDRSDSETRELAYDEVWVKQIKAALLDNRFRLVQQPVASLLGKEQGLYDVLIRMTDENGDEVLPSAFLPAAERNDLTKPIDRWVIGAAMAFCQQRRPDAVFVRLSRASVNDSTLVAWLQNQLTAMRVPPAQLCFQVTEEVASQYLEATRMLAENLRQLGFRFALEHFGSTTAAARILAQVGADFVKIDGTLMQGLAHSVQQQDKVKQLVLAAREAGSATIAERVEDANTMAVLWQIGVGFMQGYLLNKPEEVVLG